MEAIIREKLRKINEVSSVALLRESTYTSLVNAERRTTKKGTLMTMDALTLKAYLANGMNVCIAGEPGDGKHGILQNTVDELGFKLCRYIANGRPITAAERVKELIQEAKGEPMILLVDELSFVEFSSLEVERILAELIDFGTVEGNPIPTLHSVVVSYNRGYGTQPSRATLSRLWELQSVASRH